MHICLTWGLIERQTSLGGLEAECVVVYGSAAELDPPAGAANKQIDSVDFARRLFPYVPGDEVARRRLLCTIASELRRLGDFYLRDPPIAKHRSSSSLYPGHFFGLEPDLLRGFCTWRLIITSTGRTYYWKLVCNTAGFLARKSTSNWPNRPLAHENHGRV